MSERVHSFYAIAFLENLSLKELAPASTAPARASLQFDLGDRYGALATKLGSVQEALTLVLDVARDRRLVLLEVAVVLLIVLEIVLSLLRLS